MDERRRLQAVPVSLATQLARRHPAQLRIHERQQPIERAVIAAIPLIQQAGDVRRGGHGCPKDCLR